MSENRNFILKSQFNPAFRTLLWSMGCCGALLLLLCAANQKKKSALPTIFDKVGKLFSYLSMSPGIWTSQ